MAKHTRRNITAEQRWEIEAIQEDLAIIAEEMYGEIPVWRTPDFDAEITSRWEAKNKKTIAKFEKLSTGRNSFLNLVDWVKAHHTKKGQTFTVPIGPKGKEMECRVWWPVIGKVHGTKLMDEETVSRIVSAISLLSSGMTVAEIRDRAEWEEEEEALRSLGIKSKN